MSISFLTIPLDLRSPGQRIEFDNSNAVRGRAPQRYVILVTGLKLAAAPAAVGVPIQIFTEAHAIDRFGRGSMLARMFKFLRLADAQTEAWAVPQAEVGGGTAATATLTVAAGPSVSGTLPYYVAAQSVPVGVSAGQTVTQVATAIAAAVNATADLPVTATSAAGVVTLTARHKGAYGNDFDHRVTYYQGETTPAGLVLAQTAFSGGATNPDLTAVFTAIGGMGFGAFVNPYNDAGNLLAIETALAARWGQNKQSDGFSYSFAQGAFSALATLGQSRNSQFNSIGGLRGPLNPPFELAASYAGVNGYAMSVDPARGTDGLILPGILAPARIDRLDPDERELLLHDGISTFKVDSGGNVIIDRPITTWQTNSYGLADISYLDVNTMLTLSYLRYSMRSWIASRFPRYKLVDDGTPISPGSRTTSPSGVHASLVAWGSAMQDAGLIENLEAFKAALRVERDTSSADRVNAVLPPDIVNQFRVFAGQIQFVL